MPVLRCRGGSAQLGLYACGDFDIEGFATTEPIVLAADTPFAVQEHRIRQPAVVVTLPHPSLSSQQSHPQSQLFGESAGVRLIHIFVDADDLEVGPVQGRVQTIQQRQLLAAGATPAGPEGDERHLSPQLFQRQRVAVEALQGEASELAALSGAVGEEGASW